MADLDGVGYSLIASHHTPPDKYREGNYLHLTIKVPADVAVAAGVERAGKGLGPRMRPFGEAMRDAAIEWLRQHIEEEETNARGSTEPEDPALRRYHIPAEEVSECGHHTFVLDEASGSLRRMSREEDGPCAAREEG